MSYLVVWYSRTSHTKTVGNALAEHLRADTEEIIDKKNRKGFWNWLVSGKDAYRKNKTTIEFHKDPQKYDLVILGTPVWANTMTPAMRTYIEENQKNFKKVAIFCTQGAPGCEKALSQMELLIGQVVAKVDFQAKTIDSGTYMSKLEEFVKKIRS